MKNKFTITFGLIAFAITSLSIVVKWNGTSKWLFIKKTGNPIIYPSLAQSDSNTNNFGEPPVNENLANSPWPTFHCNSYAQASTSLRGPEAGDKIDVKYIRLNLKASPWSQISEKYPSGERVVWGSSVTHLFKVLVFKDDFRLIDSYRIDNNRFTPHFNLILLKGKQINVPDFFKRQYYSFTDQNPNDYRSKIILKNTFKVPDELTGRPTHYNITYDGRIIILTTDGSMASTTLDYTDWKYFKIPTQKGEVNFHNEFAIDEDGGMYIVTTQRMLRVNWDGNQFRIAWSAPYDFKGGNLSGSGTTPTLMGWGKQDKLVLVVDGRTPNNMIAFWRDKIPSDWKGLPGYDRRVAAVTPLPYSTPQGRGKTAENSPTAWGYDIAVAQYNGLFPGCNPVKGVQKLTWNPNSRKLNIAWVNNKINLNNVLTYSKGSNLVYGSGRRKCTYYFWGLDWNTGEIKLEIPLGNTVDYLDQGYQVSINDDRSAIFNTFKGIVRIRPIE